jgi:hypothetical protein
MIQKKKEEEMLRDTTLQEDGGQKNLDRALYLPG